MAHAYATPPGVLNANVKRHLQSQVVSVNGVPTEVHNDYNIVVDEATGLAAAVSSTAPAADAAGMVVRPVPSTAPQPVSGTVSVANFPATQPVSGTVAVSNYPSSFAVSNFPATQPVSGTVAVSNFPATQPVSLASLPALAAGTARIGAVRPVDSADADLTAAKGAQTGRFLGVQRSCDAGRTPWCGYAEAVAGATAATLISLTVATVPGTAGTAATSYTVPVGKTLRLTHLVANFIATTTTANTAKLRMVALTSGTLAASSPVVFSLPRIGFETTTFVANESSAPFFIVLPDGFEFAAGTIIGMTHQEVAANGTVDVALFGFLY